MNDYFPALSPPFYVLADKLRGCSEVRVENLSDGFSRDEYDLYIRIVVRWEVMVV